jgi:hypothetical protein
MSNSQIRDVLVIIDTETILKKYPPHPTEPVKITDPEGLVAFQYRGAPATPHLYLDGRPLDVIRLRERSISLNNEESAVLFYDFYVSPRAKLMTRPEPIVYRGISPVPGDVPTKPEMQRIDQYLWQSTVIATGSTMAEFFFMILKEGAGNEFLVAGRYFWRFALDIGFNGEEQEG